MSATRPAVTAALDVADAFGPLRVCVNCAGTGNAIRTVGKHGAFPLAEFTRIIEINLIGTFNVLRLAAERMLAHDPVGDERGVIVNTASVAAFDGQIGQAAYSASKGGDRRHDAADRARSGEPAHPGRDDRAGPVRHAAAGGRAGGRQRPRLASRCRTRPGSAIPPSTARSPVHIVANPMLNGETIRLDGAIRMAPK